MYIHPQSAGGDDETWGSIYLKTVVKGVLAASPELHPAYPGTSDLSLYVLDPRETYFRRARVGSAHHGNTDTAGSEVWTGKGLVSWSLAEHGQGKNLIAGRLERDVAFTTAIRTQGMSALEALMAADQMGNVGEESWGIDISLGLNMGLGAPGGFARARASSPAIQRRRSGLEKEESGQITPAYPRQQKRASVPSAPQTFDIRGELPAHPSSSSYSHDPPFRPSHNINHASSPIDPPRAHGRQTKSASTGGRPRKVTASSHSSSTSVDGADPRQRLAHSQRSYEIPLPSSEGPNVYDALSSIPENILARPESLTREQAQRLLASPAFIDMLGKITGTSIPTGKPNANNKRPRDGEHVEVQPPKRKRGRPTKAEKAAKEAQEAAARLAEAVKQKAEAVDGPQEDSRNPVCWNCGRTKSAIWRTKMMENGQSVRVCNACGLYWNKLGTMRPPNLWADGDDDRRSERAQSTFSEAPSEHGPAHRVDKPLARAQESFKRTLSAAVEQDARRMATRHKGRAPTSPNKHSKLGPMTSPPRGSASATKSLKQGKYAAASSPGGFMEAMHDSFESEVNEASPEDGNESPHFRARPAPHPHRLTRNPPSNTDTRTLDLPLSDDGLGSGAPHGNNEWNDEVSAFFDVEGFSMSTMVQHETPEYNRRHHGQEVIRETKHGAHRSNPIHVTSSSMMENEHVGTDSTLEEDTVLSQLFNRTSSIAGPGSSPSGFDFSQLPPSSPPMSVLSSDALPHSALLLSSPVKKNTPSVSGQTPNASGLTPADGNRLPQSSSKLRHSINAGDSHDNDRQAGGNGDIQQLDFEGIQRMFNLMSHPDDVSQKNTPAGTNHTPLSTFEDPQYGALNELIDGLNGDTSGMKMSVGVEMVCGGEGETSSASAVLADGNGEDIFASFLDGGAFV